ncbi:conserved hypothetical protein [Candidatus Sulfobium mesophilum]|uniref:Low affinity iron permease family protein n=1 Tax=Candidatus Sulfobium mesophilum TaxID=2016548 RepID=A0A2U3QF53_9BACT|nr:conserved hypothetical protein [Candidatus Sulfobium mesophilum]
MRSAPWFNNFAKWSAYASGHSVTFIIAISVIIIWVITGPIFRFSDAWQLVINTGTTIVTFFMVFLIQNTQNRNTNAIQIKLDELIRAVEGAHNALLDLEELDDTELELIKTNYEKLAARAREALRKGKKDTKTPDVTHAKQ